MHTFYAICIWCLVIFMDLTHLWCLGFDINPLGDAIIEAIVAGSYDLGPVDQVVEPEDGVPAQSI